MKAHTPAKPVHIKINTDKYVLRLYISGITPQSTMALTNLHKICKQYLNDTYTLEVVDIYQQVNMALEDNVFAAPTLVRKKPIPLLHITGDLANKEHVMTELGIIGLKKSDH
jgi:circadian clock protein KaiB